MTVEIVIQELDGPFRSFQASGLADAEALVRLLSQVPEVTAAYIKPRGEPPTSEPTD